jgi:uncharacterized protein YecE (DUF72 family)
MALYIGTSGWDYRQWQAQAGAADSQAFYPAGLPRSRYLEHYARRLSACEINATFYREPTENALRRWRTLTPAPFRFAVKAHRMLTYARALSPSAERRRMAQSFFAAAASLGERLGPVLLQVPAFVEQDPAALDHLLALVPAAPFAVDFRHPSWYRPAVASRVAEAGGTLCLSESDGGGAQNLPPGPLAYVRLRGDHYAEAVRSGWIDLLRGEGERRHVYVFTKHKGAPPDDSHAGVGLARWLEERRSGG